MKTANTTSTVASLTLVLPGPDRKRTLAPYMYRVTYRNPDPDATGCAMTWDVLGGRERYQISLERKPDGLTWHCTCADAVYRGELNRNHLCKHVLGLLECLPATHAKRAG